METDKLGELNNRPTFTTGIDAKYVLNGRLDDTTVRQAVEVDR